MVVSMIRLLLTLGSKSKSHDLCKVFELCDFKHSCKIVDIWKPQTSCVKGDIVQ